jgi:DNA adenine methylase
MAKPILPWMGGKRRLAKHILPLFPEHDCYVEAFAGSAALFFMKPPAKTEVLNDVHGELVNLYRITQHHLDEFVRHFRWSLVSRQMFEWLKMSPTEPLTDIQRASRFYFLQKTAFGARPTSQTFGTAPSAPPKLNLLRIEEDLSQAHLRLSRAYIERLDWQDVVKRYDRPYTLFYLDPPYHQVTGYGSPFPPEQYHLMAELARQVQGKMIISINDHPDIRQAFAGLPMREVSTTYTVGKKASQARELLILNWEAAV